MDQAASNLAQALERALADCKAGRLVEAERLSEQIVAANGDSYDAVSLLAVVQARLGKGESALATFDRAIALRPYLAVAHNNRGNALQRLDRDEEALASYDRAIELRPDFAMAYSDRGNSLRKLKRYEEAVASYDRALALRPDFPEAHSNRGNVLQALNRYEEAVASYDRAIALQPSYAVAYYNRGNGLQALKRYQDAVASYDRAIELRPGFAQAELNRSLSRLVIGDFERGWQGYEWRMDVVSPGNSKRSFARPQWSGREDLAGKTIYLHAEQGLGDTIQLCRFVPMVAARGARVILEVPAPLVELMASLAGVTQIVCNGDPMPDFDIQCPLLSLPLAFGIRLETIPSGTPYLRASAQGLAEWNARLAPKTRPRIGLAWSGELTHPNDRNRSIRLGALSSLLDVDAEFVSLQKDVRAEDAIVLQARGDLRHFGDTLRTFSDTAALVSQLDLVISIDTSVVHLAGALAKPVWVLVPFNPDWRWLLDRGDSPWYPTARLFRQDETRTWDSVIARVHAALRDFVQSR